MKATLLILGMLHGADLHPYEMKRRLGAAMVECYLDVDVGTLYYAVRQLEREGAIAAIVKEHVARGGTRTTYRITDTGREAFQDEVRRQFGKEGPVSSTLYAALLFLRHIAPDQLLELVRQRIARTEAQLVELTPLREQMLPRLTGGADHLFNHIEGQRRFDRAWLGELLSALEADKVPLPSKHDRPDHEGGIRVS